MAAMSLAWALEHEQGVSAVVTFVAEIPGGAQRPWSGEEELAAAVIERAWQDAAGMGLWEWEGRGRGWRREEKPQRDAWQWLFHEMGSREDFSFEYLCAGLGLDAERLRERMRRALGARGIEVV